MKTPKETPQVPTPENILGFSLGSRAVHYTEMLSCLQAWTHQQPRARLEAYGETPTGRRLYQIIISAPRHLERLSEIQQQLQKLGEPGLDEAAARRLAQSLPAVAWLGYGIHGDEISGTDAALALIHQLLSNQDAATQELLDKLVIYIDPNFNPEGRERCLAHHEAYARKMPALDPQDVFHWQFWPGGRGNHYLFDLNRDATFTVQQQSRQRVAAIRLAQPQLYVDAHEMDLTDSYLFASPAEPLNPHLPAAVHQSWEEFGVEHGEALDRIGTAYYTRSWNEVFYPGFFDIWPAYHGAVPILYEQSATAGAAVELPSGKTRDYREAVNNQLVSSLTNLKSAAARKDTLLHRWWLARNQAAGNTGGAQFWLIPPLDAYKQRRLLQILHTQGIRYQKLSQAVAVANLHSAWEVQAQRHTLPAGTLCISAAQPLGALVRNIFDFHVPLAADFVQRERQGIDSGGKTLLFDATAWSLPLAFGIAAYWTRQAPDGEWQDVISDNDGATSAPGKPAAARFGYLYSDPSLATTLKLLQAGIKVRVAREPFATEQDCYPAGTFLIRLDDQTNFSPELIGTDFTALQSARVMSGPDFGGDEFALLTAPKIAIVTGNGMLSASSGALWHTFDVELGAPVALLELAQLVNYDLSRYNVIVLADSDGSAALGDALKGPLGQQLISWLQQGGTLIALSSSARACSAAGLVQAPLRSAVMERYPALNFGRTPAESNLQDFIKATGSQGNSISTQCSWTPTAPVVGPGMQPFMPAGSAAFAWSANMAGAAVSTTPVAPLKYLPKGAYLRVDLKPQHWLGYGSSERLPVLFRESDTFIVDNAAIELVGRYAAPQELVLSGLVWPEAAGFIADTAYLLRERQGRGQVILFATDPVFRGYSLGTRRLFLNAAILGPGLREV